MSVIRHTRIQKQTSMTMEAAAAMEELEILEFQHPNGFHSLKMELRAFISDIAIPIPITVISTQESSSSSLSGCKRKKMVCQSVSERMKKMNYYCKRTDAVLRRAQQCLSKIQQFKISLCD